MHRHFRPDEAREAILYSYSCGFSGFAALLNSTQAATLSGKELFVRTYMHLPRNAQFTVDVHLQESSWSSQSRNSRGRISIQESDAGDPYNKELGFHGPPPAHADGTTIAKAFEIWRWCDRRRPWYWYLFMPLHRCQSCICRVLFSYRNTKSFFFLHFVDNNLEKMVSKYSSRKLLEIN